MENNDRTVQLSEEQIDEIARRAAKYAVKEEVHYLMRFLDAMKGTPLAGLAEKVRKLAKSE